MQTRLATIMRGAGPNRLSKTVGTIVAVIGLALLVILPVPQSAARPLAGLDTTPDLTQTGQLDHNNIVAPADLSAIENEATRSEPHEQAVRCMAVSPNGRFLIVGRGNWATPGRVRVWDVEQRREVFYTDEKWGVAAVAVSSDNKYFASSTWGDEHVVSVRSTETFKLQSRFATGKKVVRLAFSPNGDLATASEAGELRIWSPLDGSERRKFGTEPYSLTKLAFSPDGKWLAACGGDINPSASAGSERSNEPSGRAVVWNVATGTQRFSLPPQDNPLLDIAFSNDGNTIATLGVGRSVRVWNATTGHEEANFKNQVSPLSIDFCPASDRLLASFADGRVKVWDVASQTLNSEFRPSQSPVMAAKFSVDGTGVFATNEFARVQL
ncbi:MAG: WD40 repeat protein, partial [Pirellulaceae bacterium]